VEQGLWYLYASVSGYCLAMSKFWWLPILLLSFFVGRFLVYPGFFPVHDTTHIARLYLMDQAVRAGQFPPIWADTANFGYGYPLFHFYAPLSYYYGLLLKLFLPSYLLAIKSSFLTALVLAGWGMYLLCKQAFKQTYLSSLLAAFAFLLSPYLAVDLYVRGALAELWATALLPWLFLAWHKLSLKPRSILITALITTLFLLSHNLIPLITFPFLLVWIFLHHYRLLKPVFLASLFAFGFASFYLLPLLFEQRFTALATIARTTNYSLHFVQPWQLLNSSWGFGGSAPGVEDGLSFKLGKLHLLLAALSLPLFFRRRRFIYRTVLLFFIFAVCFATPLTRPLWDLLPPLQMVQFPWRFLALMIFLLAILIGFSPSLISNSVIKTGYVLGAIFLLLFFNLKYFHPQSQDRITDSTYLEGDYIPANLARIVPEYLPAALPGLANASASALPREVVGPQALTLPRAYYPTWLVKLNGEKVPASPTPDGLLRIKVPEGTHVLTLSQGHTPLELFALSLSLLTLIIAYPFSRLSRL